MGVSVCMCYFMRVCVCVLVHACEYGKPVCTCSQMHSSLCSALPGIFMLHRCGRSSLPQRLRKQGLHALPAPETAQAGPACAPCRRECARDCASRACMRSLTQRMCKQGVHTLSAAENAQETTMETASRACMGSLPQKLRKRLRKQGLLAPCCTRQRTLLHQAPGSAPCCTRQRRLVMRAHTRHIGPSLHALPVSLFSASLHMHAARHLSAPQCMLPVVSGRLSESFPYHRLAPQCTLPVNWCFSAHCHLLLVLQCTVRLTIWLAQTLVDFWQCGLPTSAHAGACFT